MVFYKFYGSEVHGTETEVTFDRIVGTKSLPVAYRPGFISPTLVPRSTALNYVQLIVSVPRALGKGSRWWNDETWFSPSSFGRGSHCSRNSRTLTHGYRRRTFFGQASKTDRGRKLLPAPDTRGRLARASKCKMRSEYFQIFRYMASAIEDL